MHTKHKKKNPPTKLLTNSFTHMLIENIMVFFSSRNTVVDATTEKLAWQVLGLRSAFEICLYFMKINGL